jgi:beta-glucosidase
MKASPFRLVIASLVFSALAVSAYAENNAIVPAERLKDKWWKDRHEASVALVEKGNVDVLMIGDSITHGWEGSGKDVWDKYYGSRKAINLGFSGDQTQHVLWRLDRLPLDKISPRVAVIMIGTNNNRMEPKDTAEGIKAIVEKLQTQYPKMQVLVLYVFARGPNLTDKYRKKVDAVNSYLPGLLKDKRNVTLLDINNVVIDKEGNLPKEVMPDFLHPNAEGYQLWADAMEPTLKKLLAQSETKFRREAPRPFQNFRRNLRGSIGR